MLGHETVALSARRQRQEKPRQRGQARKDQGLPRPIRSPWSAQAPGPPAPRLQQMQAGAAAAVPSKKISWRLPFLTGSSKRCGEREKVEDVRACIYTSKRKREGVGGWKKREPLGKGKIRKRRMAGKELVRGSRCMPC
ncbi:hypothetical protein BHE74_00007605 [Ensete ventricosum]|nr:hypothetical protein GW17_00040131 [Ensete ventricosum]RWW83874.1 hypothetical protein BHE74_00007605 [Ensete ventricosum]RZR95570.1 hypothetical protein BHM03_00024430 [Ensete ventricosum]